MRNFMLILLLFTSISNIFSQVQSVEDSILRKELSPLKENLNRSLYQSSIGYDESRQGVSVNKYELLLQYSDMYRLNNTFSPLKEYVGPSLKESSIIYNPFVNDYSFSSIHDISDGIWFSSSSLRSTYPTGGGISQISSSLYYQPVDWLMISGGIYTAKYDHVYGEHGERYFNDVGVNGSFKFILHDRVRINAFGQYSVYGKSNKVGSPMMNMFPYSYYGGSIEFKITEKFGVEGGIIRELNPFNGKWQNRTFVAPVFYGK